VRDRAWIAEADRWRSGRRVAKDPFRRDVARRGDWKHERGVIAVVRDPDLAVLQVVGDAHRSENTGARALDDAHRRDVARVGAPEDPDRAVAVVRDGDFVAP